MFKFDDRDVRRLERTLEKIKDRAIPFATKSTLNSAAFLAQKIWRADVASTMTLRNKFTQQSMRVVTTRTLNVRQQAAIVGSIADYMETQEFGGTKTKKGKEGVSLTTGYAAGQQGQQPRTRLARKANSLRTIQLKSRGRKGATRGQRNLIAVKQAAGSNNKFIFMDLGRRKGLFKVIGGKRNPRVKMVHDLTKQSVRIPANKSLTRSVDKTNPALPALYAEALRFQLKRLRAR